MSMKRMIAALASLVMFTGCKSPAAPAEPAASTEAASTPAATASAEAAAPAEKNGDIVVLYTSDIHCGFTKGMGFVGLQQIRDTLELGGTETLLVDNGDAIQGEAIGTLSHGEAMTKLMNELKYDLAIPGNHEFDFGMDAFMHCVDIADFPFISCNFNKEGELVLEPYLIKEIGGKKIGFVGVTTPNTVLSTAPTTFMDADGKVIYDFMCDKDGTKLFKAIQDNVDAVRKQGVDYVFLMGHIGGDEKDAPFNFQNVIENTTGIDAFIDGHSHDTDQVTMNNKDGEEVVRTACGTKMQSVGYVKIAGKDGSISSGLYSWPNSDSAPELFRLENSMSEPVARELDKLDGILSEKIGETAFKLTITDPEVLDDKGNEVRLVRRAETNLGDLAADAIRAGADADIAIVNGGGIRVSIEAGDITYGDVLSVFPFNNTVDVAEVTGQQILDCLEWGAKAAPEESPCLMHPSGLTYEIHTEIPSHVSADTDGHFASVDGEYRVKNVMVNGEPLDLKKKYTLASTNFILREKGDGMTMFSEEDIVNRELALDNQLLINYIKDDLKGVISDEYADPYGSGRIVVTGLD